METNSNSVDNHGLKVFVFVLCVTLINNENISTLLYINYTSFCV